MMRRASTGLSGPQLRMLVDIARVGGERAYWAATDRMGGSGTWVTRAADRTLASLVRRGLVTDGEHSSEYEITPAGRAVLARITALLRT